MDKVNIKNTNTLFTDLIWDRNQQKIGISYNCIAHFREGYRFHFKSGNPCHKTYLRTKSIWLLTLSLQPASLAPLGLTF